jgi:hypothetical protein
LTAANLRYRQQEQTLYQVLICGCRSLSLLTETQVLYKEVWGMLLGNRVKDATTKNDFFCIQQDFLPFVDLWHIREENTYICKYKKLNSMALVRERTIPTEWPPPVGEVSANFCG